MLDSFLTFINQFSPALSKRPTLVATSGGIDSMVLLDLFARANLPVVVAHCNFGLRGQASIDDEAFVRSMAKNYAYPFERFGFATKSEAKDRGVSTQMVARFLRYEWFENLRNNHDLNWIATAHHLNDSLETSLLNLTRGTGIAGLKGVPVKNGAIIRPLLFTNRKEIEGYAKLHKISWVEDQSNASLDYDRNRIRHRVIPVLQSLNPALEEGFRRTSEKIRAADRLLEEFLASWAHRVLVNCPGGKSILYSHIWEVSEPEYRLWHLLSDYGFGYNQIGAILEASRSESGRRFYSETHCLLADRDAYILQKLQAAAWPDEKVFERAPAQFTFRSGLFEMVEEDVSTGFLPVADLNTAYFDAEKVHWPLRLRIWRQGDRIKPFGMGGQSQKVSDILVDRKISLFEKETIRVLEDADGQILWVVGLRASQKGRLNNETQRMIRINFTPNA